MERENAGFTLDAQINLKTNGIAHKSNQSTDGCLSNHHQVPFDIGVSRNQLLHMA